MSKLRSVCTSFWSDPFIEELKPSEKLLYLYLITNEKTNMLGIYELSTRKMSFETGILVKDIESHLKHFESLGKVKLIGTFVVICKYMKHQNYNTNMMKSAIAIYESLPDILKIPNTTLDYGNPLKAFETLSYHYGMVRKLEYEVEDELEDEVKDEKKFKKDIAARQNDFKEELKPFLEQYGKDLLNDFYLYWSEPTQSKTPKMKKETMDTWSTAGRLNTWKKKEKGFNGTTPEQAPRTFKPFVKD